MYCIVYLLRDWSQSYQKIWAKTELQRTHAHFFLGYVNTDEYKRVKMKNNV